MGNGTQKIGPVVFLYHLFLDLQLSGNAVGFLQTQGSALAHGVHETQLRFVQLIRLLLRNAENAIGFLLAGNDPVPEHGLSGTGPVCRVIQRTGAFNRFVTRRKLDLDSERLPETGHDFLLCFLHGHSSAKAPGEFIKCICLLGLESGCAGTFLFAGRDGACDQGCDSHDEKRDGIVGIIHRQRVVGNGEKIIEQQYSRE